MSSTFVPWYWRSAITKLYMHVLHVVNQITGKCRRERGQACLSRTDDYDSRSLRSLEAKTGKSVRRISPKFDGGRSLSARSAASFVLLEASESPAIYYSPFANIEIWEDRVSTPAAGCATVAGTDSIIVWIF